MLSLTCLIVKFRFANVFIEARLVMVLKKIVILGKVSIVVVILLLSGVFLVEQASIREAAAQGFVLPANIVTNGNAWNGTISFGLASTSGANYLVVMNTNGTLYYVRTSTSGGYGVAKNIAANTILFEGEPQTDGPSSAPTYATHIWNVATNTTQDFPNVIGEHDVDYDPANNTFLTMQPYVRTIGNNSLLYDKIVLFNSTGSSLWTWDSYNYIPLSEASPYNQTSNYNSQTVEDITHANALLWDYSTSVIYLNLRNTNTFYKINQTTGNIIWACGEFGNFTLHDINGNVVPGLWYGAHDLEEQSPDVFSIFNNDYGNVTNINNASSQLIEFTLNEQTMNAYVNWSWAAPNQYYTQFLGANDLLPNGDWLGDFGSNTHRFTQNAPWNFNDTGADIIEVNPAGQIVRTISFPTGWLIYRTQLDTLGSALVTPLPTPTPLSTPSPTPTPNETLVPTEIIQGTPNPANSQTPTQPASSTSSSPAQTQSPQTSGSTKPSVQSNNAILIYGAIVIVVFVVVVAAVLGYLRTRRKTTKDQT